MSEISNRLHAGRQRVQVKIARNLEAAVDRVWADVDPSDDGLNRWVGSINDPTNVARLLVGRATTAYFALWAASGGKATKPVDVDRVMIDASSVSRWAPAPVVRLRKRLSEGVDYDQAKIEAGSYAQGLASLEVTWADMQAMNAIGKEAGVKWRRVPSGTACDFCWDISTKLYRRIDQIKVHRWCHCTVAPYHVDIDGLMKDLPRPVRVVQEPAA